MLYINIMNLFFKTVVRMNMKNDRVFNSETESILDKSVYSAIFYYYISIMRTFVFQKSACVLYHWRHTLGNYLPFGR